MTGLGLRLYHRLPAPTRSVAATLRGLVLRWWRYGPESERLMRDALEREQWSAARWRAWREERLAYVLDRAARRVPYYREQWQARRRRGDRASWEVLSNWPILEKEAVRRDPHAFVADDRAVRRMFHVRTSGTTGTPLEIWRSREAVRQLYAIGMARTRGWHGVGLSDRRAMLGGQLVTPVGQREPPFWVWNAGLRQLYMSSYHLAPDLVGHYLDALSRYRVVYLVGYASSLHALAHEALRLGRRDLVMVVALASAEPLHDAARQAIEAAFRCPVRETYGMAENVAAATECEAGRLHQWPEVGLIEVRDAHEAMPPGATGEFLCTGLLNADMPFIRYRVGDWGRMAADDERCACGRTLPVIAGIDGRTQDTLLTRDGRRVFWLNPILYGIPVREAQFVQQSLDRVLVRYAAGPDFTAASRRLIVERLQARMGDVQVAWEEVPALPRSAGRKVRSVVCNIPAAEQEAVLGRGADGARASR